MNAPAIAFRNSVAVNICSSQLAKYFLVSHKDFSQKCEILLKVDKHRKLSVKKEVGRGGGF
jgi:hypothetical protein